jgi:hypothetical protein
VFPIVRERCGRCHVPGGVAPMSLMTYKEAYPWGESIRTELIAGHMPPGQTEQAVGTFRNVHALTAKELNTLLVWVTGGNPMGSADHATPAVSLEKRWPLGMPDEVLAMPAAVTVPADKNEVVQEFVVPVRSNALRWLRAVDLLPGTPAVVRSATISVKDPSSEARDRAAAKDASDAGSEIERTLGAWLPGNTPVALEGTAAFQLPANAELVVRIHYKKTWENERKEMTDQSSLGLYFTPGPSTALRAFTVSAPAQPVAAAATSLSFSRTVSEDLEAVAVYPAAALADADIAMRAERPDGSSVDLIRFRPQPDWQQRYWYDRPIALPRGTRVTVIASFVSALLPPGAAPVAARRPDPAALRVTLDVVGK